MSRTDPGDGAVGRVRGEELLDVERQPVGPLNHAVDDLSRRLVPEDRGRLLDDLQAIERGHVEPLNPGRSLKLREQPHQRVSPMQLVASNGAHDQEAFVADVAEQEAQQIPGRAVRPVEVLEHQQHRRHRGQSPDDVDDRIEEAGLSARLIPRIDRLGISGRRLAKIGDKPGEGLLGRTEHGRNGRFRLATQVPDESLQRLGEWREWEPTTAQIEAAADERASPTG